MIGKNKVFLRNLPVKRPSENVSKPGTTWLRI